MKNLTNWLKKYGYNFRVEKMTDGKDGVFIQYDVLTTAEKEKLMKYIRTYQGGKYEFRGHYTSILLTYDAEKTQKKSNQQILQEEFGKLLLPSWW